MSARPVRPSVPDRWCRQVLAHTRCGAMARRRCSRRCLLKLPLGMYHASRLPGSACPSGGCGVPCRSLFGSSPAVPCGAHMGSAAWARVSCHRRFREARSCVVGCCCLTRDGAFGNAGAKPWFRAIVQGVWDVACRSDTDRRVRYRSPNVRRDIMVGALRRIPLPHL